MSVLTNKTYKNYDRWSRYSSFPYYYHTKDDKYVYGTTQYLDDTTVYTLYTVKRNDTLDSIALDYYNNPTYFWIICSFNHIQDPFIELKEGQQLKIPSISNLKFKE